MMDPQLTKALLPVAARFRHRRLVLLLTCSWLLLGILLAVIYFRPPSWVLPPMGLVSVAGLIATLLVTACWILAHRTARDPLYVAGQIESAFPDLDALLLTAVDQTPDLRHGHFTFLQLRVIRRSLHHARLNRWSQIIPSSQLWIGHTLHVMALVGLIGFASLWILHPPPAPASIPGPGIVLQDGTLPDGTFQFEVVPGNTEIEKNSSLLITARFSQEMPDRVTLLVSDGEGNQRELPMRRSLDDPVFGVHLPRIATPLDYHLEIGQQQSDEFHVEVFEFPELRQADATMEFPEYTGMQPRTVEDTRRVTAVEGTSLTWSCQLNKSVNQAWLETESGEKLALELGDPEKATYTVNTTLVSSERYRLHLRDDRGRANQEPPELVVNAMKNKPPTLKLTSAGDRRVSALEEMDIGANASDDFGLEEFGVSYSIGGDKPVEIKLGASIAGNMEQVIDYLIDFESLKAEPDQLLSFHFWVVDYAADGNLRRTFSDMFFAEVRPFEEIFRQGQQPPGGEQQQQEQQQEGESQNEQQAAELAELQKQIISATWNILRRETLASVSETFADDLRLLMVSQQQVIEQVEQLKQALQDDRSRGHADSASGQMEAVLQQLSRAIETSSTDSLQEALSLEQAAYQDLLKLRAREYEVTQQQQSQQSSSSQQSSQSAQQQALQQQLDELELEEDENRYETARTEQTPGETPEQQQQREVLNRLKELAERQGDLNEQIEELKSALEAAEEEEQEELERQLKRLREQQQEILRDTDQLQEQMSESQNQQQMQESRQQLEETRENIREASEALQQGQLPQASASGVRAERELEEMRDDFRQRTANQFEEEVQQLSELAEQLQEREQDIAEKLRELDEEEPRGLRDNRPREQISEAVKGQEEDLQKLLEGMRDTIERAESAEPLLSRQLYDTLRNTQHDRLEEALEGTRQLLDAGFTQEAEEPEEVARKGIDRLNQGVQQAAESVLGDPVEALRRAEQALQQAAEDLEQEIDRSQPGEPSQTPPQPGQQPGEPSETPPQPGQQPGEPSETPPQPGQQPGEPSETPPQPGQQPGEPSETPPQPGQQPGEPSETPPRPGQQPGDPTAPRQGIEQLFGPGGEDRAPLTGNDFRQWSDQLRNVEEMLDDPDLRSDVARLREQARSIRAEYKRQSKEPNWDLVRENLLEPLVELQQQIHEEVLRNQSRDALVPIDRDPVPDRYSEQVKRYYEQLGNERAGRKKPE
ncbi:MAG: DUF4175 family protein [Planctomycetota bacterium]|nr:DUF4175 family protein [Planctomycetota bacterium]